MKEIEFAAGAENDPYGFKPTDLVVDRDGSLLIADWADGQRPKRGRARIYRVQYVGHVSNVPVKPAKAGDVENVPDDLAGWVDRLNSDSYYERLEAQLVIEKQGRGDPVGVLELLGKRVFKEQALMHAVWIRARIQGPKATEVLFSVATNYWQSRAGIQAIRALADIHDPVLVEHRLDAGSGNPQVAGRFADAIRLWRLGSLKRDVVIALGRLKWSQAPHWMSKKESPFSPVMAHVAQQTLRRCGDWSAVLRLLDSSPPSRSNFSNSRRKV